MIAAETSRSRAYLQAMARHDLLPSFVILMDNATGPALPGQQRNASPRLETETADEWSEASFDPSIPVRELLERFRIPYAVVDNQNINDPAVIEAIVARPEPVFVYSGFGGAILRQAVFATGKRFLHVHGGYLPDYKGSTTNYYSILDQNLMGASALFLSEVIDSGTVLLRRAFTPPRHREGIDHVYDSAARCKVLVDTLRHHVSTGEWPVALPENAEGETYYIIHPVLKHIAILGGG